MIQGNLLAIKRAEVLLVVCDSYLKAEAYTGIVWMAQSGGWDGNGCLPLKPRDDACLTERRRREGPCILGRDASVIAIRLDQYKMMRRLRIAAEGGDDSSLLFPLSSFLFSLFYFSFLFSRAGGKRGNYLWRYLAITPL